MDDAPIVEYKRLGFSYQFKAVKTNPNKTIEFQRMSNVQDLAPAESFLTLVYMARDNERTEYCQDWWYFKNDGECISHACNITRNGDDIGGTHQPDKDISHLLQEKDLLKSSLERAERQLNQGDYHQFKFDPIYTLIKKIIDQQ